MEYEEFKEIVEEIGYGPKNTWDTPKHGVSLDYQGRYADGGEALMVSWKTGGAEGGSCWGDEPYAISPEEPVDLTPVLAAILGAVAPSISFLQFMELQRELIESDRRSHHEYYGNWTEEAVRFITIKKLYDALKEMGCLND